MGQDSLDIYSNLPLYCFSRSLRSLFSGQYSKTNNLVRIFLTAIGRALISKSLRGHCGCSGHYLGKLLILDHLYMTAPGPLGCTLCITI